MSHELSSIHELVGIAHDVVVTLAALVGGVWVVFRLWRERVDQSALTIDVSVKSDPWVRNGDFLVFIGVTLRNVGKTEIVAKARRNEKGLAYSDSVEKIKYSGSLGIRSITPLAGSAPRNLDWFDQNVFIPVKELDEINLLSDYEIAEEDNKVDFWMEPNESYCLGKSIVLAPGLYAAKVTFVGARNDRDFWTRVVQFAVPATLSTP